MGMGYMIEDVERRHGGDGFEVAGQDDDVIVWQCSCCDLQVTTDAESGSVLEVGDVDTLGGLVVPRCGAPPPPPKPPCRLLGRDGNVFNVIALVQRALREAGQPERAAEFVKLAFAAPSYEHVLALCFDYVEVR